MSARCIPAAVVDTDCDRIPVTVWLEQPIAEMLEAMAALSLDTDCDEQEAIDLIVTIGIALAEVEFRDAGIVR
jgi:hypothetical protein